MSTFLGVLAELPSIRVDYFADNDGIGLFFLSHCHTDHMTGIESLAKVPNARLITSAMSALIVREMHPALKDMVQVIDIWTEQLFTARDGTQFMCSAIPAGHCPGSVMFYFETADRQTNALYTGDFRLMARDLTQLKILDRIKKTRCSLYLDSTFLLPAYRHFPAQAESAKAVCDLIDPWLNMSAAHKVFIQVPARFGLENLFIDVHKRTHQRMYLWDLRNDFMGMFIPEMRDIFTNTELNVRVYVGRKMTPDLRSQAKWRILRPSAMFWTDWRPASDSIVQRLDDGRGEFYRICYSNHSSCAELEAFIKYMTPVRVSLNAVPERTKDRLMETLSSIWMAEETAKAETQLQETPIREHSFRARAIAKGDLTYKRALHQLKEEDGDEDSPPLRLPEKRTRT